MKKHLEKPIFLSYNMEDSTNQMILDWQKKI